MTAKSKKCALAGVVCLCVLTGILWSLRAGPDRNSALLDAAYAVHDGGGYASLTGTGVAHDIVHKGVIIIHADPKNQWFCCGFTFGIVFEVLEKFHDLDRFEPTEIAEFQRIWYGNLKGAQARQAVMAIERFHLGRQVTFDAARAGDIIVFSRLHSGHSAIFLSWVFSGGNAIGFRYRSSQPFTAGVGDNVEYFLDSGRRDARVRRDLTFIGRVEGNQ